MVLLRSYKGCNKIYRPNPIILKRRKGKLNNYESILQKAREAEPKIIEWRRYFHENPELALKEFKTAQKVDQELRNLGIETKVMAGGIGVRGYLKGGKPGKTIALRADIDALPMPEETDVPYKSKTPGLMHACGHDAHTAMLLGAAQILAAEKKELYGNVVFIFQPAEETGEGAKKMVEEGVLDQVDGIFGIHISTLFPIGTVNYRTGPLMAAGDFFDVKISGKGGHGAGPHLAVDPIAIAAQAMAAIQTIVGREIDPLESAVVSICKMQAGEAYNIIPGFATFGGTLRSHSRELRDYLPKRVEEIVKGVVAGMRGSYEFTLHKRFPLTSNDETMTAFAIKIAEELLGPEKVSQMKPLMGSEDFAYYLEKVPGTFIFLGVKNEAKGIIYPHHHPKFDVDEEALPKGAALYVAVAEEFLAQK
jgi:amidohydrolase